MIRLGKYIRINILTVVLFVICVFMGQLRLLGISYMTIFLHEMAHFAAARFLGLRVDNITFQPFGVNLQLKNKIIFSISDEIILYMSGPAFNILCALLLFYIRDKNEVLNYFYTCNIVLFFINIMPVSPLDGGMVLKKISARYLGYKTAERIIKFTSAVIILGLIVSELYSAYMAGINYSVIVMIVFLTGNIFTQREKYDIDFVEELMFSDLKSTGRAKVFVTRDDTDYREIAKRFNKGSYGLVIRVNNDGEITEALTEQQIIRHLTR